MIFSSGRPQQILLTIRLVASPSRPPTPMTRHRIAQIAEDRNPKSQENLPQPRGFLQIRLLHPALLRRPSAGQANSRRGCGSRALQLRRRSGITLDGSLLINFGIGR
jgi:hypothetical protein